MTTFGDRVRLQARENSPVRFSPLQAAYTRLVLKALQRVAYRLEFDREASYGQGECVLRVLANMERQGADSGREIEEAVLRRMKKIQPQ